MTLEKIISTLVKLEGVYTNCVSVYIAFDDIGNKDKVKRYRVVVSFRQLDRNKNISANQVFGHANTVLEAAQIALDKFKEELNKHNNKINSKEK